MGYCLQAHDRVQGSEALHQGQGDPTSLQVALEDHIHLLLLYRIRRPVPRPVLQREGRQTSDACPSHLVAQSYRLQRKVEAGREVLDQVDAGRRGQCCMVTGLALPDRLRREAGGGYRTRRQSRAVGNRHLGRRAVDGPFRGEGLVRGRERAAGEGRRGRDGWGRGLLAAGALSGQFLLLLCRLFRRSLLVAAWG